MKIRIVKRHTTVKVSVLLTPLFVCLILLSARIGQTTQVIGNTNNTDHDSVAIHVINDLNFGIIYCGESPGTVTVSPTGDVAASGGALIERSNGALVHAAALILVLKSGANGSIGPDEHKVFPIGGNLLSIVLPETAELRNFSGESMSIDNFTMRN